MAANVPFALNPAQANDDVLDYRTRVGQTVFQNNTRSVYNDETLFNAEAASLEGFLSALARRARQASWEHAFMVPVDIDDNGDPEANTEELNFLDHYGEFNLEHLQLYSLRHGLAINRVVLKTTFRSPQPFWTRSTRMHQPRSCRVKRNLPRTTTMLQCRCSRFSSANWTSIRTLRPCAFVKNLSHWTNSLSFKAMTLIN